jgi:hypothetical protein
VKPAFNATLNYQHVTKWAEQITTPAGAVAAMRRAFTQARNGRPGPVLIEVPGDLWGEEVPEPFEYTPTTRALSRPDAESIDAAAQVLVGIGLWTVLFVLPAKRLVQRFGSIRRIHIDTNTVTVSERGMFGSRQWSAPLSEYTGITRHLRSTLSGLRHELIMVHRESRKSVLLHSGDLASPPTIEQAVRLLGLPEIQPRELYRRGTFGRPATPAPVVAGLA